MNIDEMTRHAVDYLLLPQALYETSRAAVDKRSVSQRYFIANLDGDGMILAGIQNGDMGVFYRTDKAEDSDIVVVRIDGGQYLCRRYFRDVGRKVRIRREDGFTPDLVIQKKRTKIAGVLITLIRRYYIITSS